MQETQKGLNQINERVLSVTTKNITFRIVL